MNDPLVRNEEGGRRKEEKETRKDVDMYKHEEEEEEGEEWQGSWREVERERCL